MEEGRNEGEGKADTQGGKLGEPKQLHREGGQAKPFQLMIEGLDMDSVKKLSQAEAVQSSGESI